MVDMGRFLDDIHPGVCLEECVCAVRSPTRRICRGAGSAVDKARPTFVLLRSSLSLAPTLRLALRGVSAAAWAEFGEVWVQFRTSSWRCDPCSSDSSSSLRFSVSPPLLVSDDSRRFCGFMLGFSYSHLWAD